MPRIRTIKPDIWNSRDFMALEATGQLCFVALISLADDEGRLEDDAEHLVSVAVRRLTIDEVRAQLAVMARTGMIATYQVQGRPYIALLNWSKHQRVDHPKPSTLPPPPTRNPRERSRRLATAREDSREAPDDSRSFETSRAPADRGSWIVEGIVDRGPDARAFAGAREADPDDEPVEVLARMDLLVEAFDGHDGLLKRRLRSDERPVLMNWAHLERDGSLVPLDEIVLLAKRLLATPFRDGTLPGTLRAIEATVQTLARGPAGNGTANGAAQDREMDEMVARMEARRAAEGRA